MSNTYNHCEYCGERHKQCQPPNFEKEGLALEETPKREQKLYINQRLVGLNEIIDAARTHWSHAKKQKEEQDEIVMWAIKAARLKPVDGPFRLKLHFSEPNTARDPDNIVSAKKFILDALQKMKIIPNDNQKWVMGFEESWGKASKQTPVGVHVKIIEEYTYV